ncbi:hypothetical protein A6R68_19862, partial [Neotoma lepida]
MDFLLGNPFSSPVGQRIALSQEKKMLSYQGVLVASSSSNKRTAERLLREKATDGSLQSEDWALNMEICDIINETEE